MTTAPRTDRMRHHHSVGSGGGGHVRDEYVEFDYFT
jgi:hypothetical protein